MSEIKMKKVLILAYDFPPYVSVGGLRPYNWYRYLKEFGIEPIVVTRQWSNTHGNHLDYIAPSDNKSEVVESTEFGQIIRAPYIPNLANRIMLRHGDKKWYYLRRSISAFYEFTQFVLPVGPKIELYKAARKYLQKNHVDAIIVTGDPFILFKYASLLNKEFGMPWIADYRDPWTTNKTNIISKYLKPWNWFFERKILKSASAVTTVDKVFQRKITEVIGDKNFLILPNGYDPESINAVSGITQNSEKLKIAFVGTIYDWHPLRSILRTINEFVLTHKEINFQLTFYGINNVIEVTDMIEKEYPKLSKYVVIIPKLPNKILMEKLADANVMLLFNYYAYTGTKIYDYLAIRRKIIFCYSDDKEAIALKKQFYNIEESVEDNMSIQAEIIQSTNSGIIVKDANHLLEVLGELHQEFENTGSIACDSHGIEKYSRKIQVEKLAEIVKSIHSGL
jgi:hypothetical protein